MDDLSILCYDCGCVIRLDMNRKLDSASLCDTHHNQVVLTEKSHELWKFIAEKNHNVLVKPKR